MFGVFCKDPILLLHSSVLHSSVGEGTSFFLAACRKQLFAFARLLFGCLSEPYSYSLRVCGINSLVDVNALPFLYGMTSRISGLFVCPVAVTDADLFDPSQRQSFFAISVSQ